MSVADTVRIGAAGSDARFLFWFDPVPAELQIVRKETFNNWYRLSTYFMAHMLVTTPILIVFSVSFSSIVFVLTDQPAELDRFVRFNAVFVLSIIAGDGLGLTIGAMMDPVVCYGFRWGDVCEPNRSATHLRILFAQNGTFFGSMISTFKISLSGFLAMPSQVSGLVRVVMNLSTLSYTLEASTLALYDNRRADVACPDTEMYCHFV